MIDEAFAALADPTRRRMVELLGRGPLRAGELAAQTEMSAPALSRHLRVLRAAGLAREERDPADGRARLYHLERARLSDLRAWLDEVEAFWSEQLAAFTQFVEDP